MTRPTRVLIIDDDESFRSILQHNIRQAGYEVVCATDGRKGLEALKADSFGVVITDMKMPGLDGLEVLRAVKKASSETLVIVVTAYGSIEMAVEAMREGAHDYITKPLDREALLLTLDKALRYRDLREENLRLREELEGRFRAQQIVGRSRPMRLLMQQIEKVCEVDATVLISGETGTGKELVARAIHYGSRRKDRPLVVVNCAAIPRDLLESELFGHAKGAFTGATRDRTGKFPAADRGTLFLDEVGSMELDLQAKLLRVLQDRQVTRIGEEKPIQVDVRILAATNTELRAAVDEGRFREDLFYRLNVVPLHVPPLRERTDDLPLLVEHFIQGYAPGRRVRVVPAVLDAFRRYPWPGNVRELENVVERMLIFQDGEELGPEGLPREILGERSGAGKAGGDWVRLPPEGVSLEALEQDIVTRALEMNQWNQVRAAKFLKIPRHILLYRMEKYGIKAPNSKSPPE